MFSIIRTHIRAIIKMFLIGYSYSVSYSFSFSLPYLIIWMKYINTRMKNTPTERSTTAYIERHTKVAMLCLEEKNFPISHSSLCVLPRIGLNLSFLSFLEPPTPQKWRCIGSTTLLRMLSRPRFRNNWHLLSFMEDRNIAIQGCTIRHWHSKTRECRSLFFQFESWL